MYHSLVGTCSLRYKLAYKVKSNSLSYMHVHPLRRSTIDLSTAYFAKKLMNPIENRHLRAICIDFEFSPKNGLFLNNYYGLSGNRACGSVLL